MMRDYKWILLVNENIYDVKPGEKKKISWLIAGGIVFICISSALSPDVGQVTRTDFCDLDILNAFDRRVLLRKESVLT